METPQPQAQQLAKTLGLNAKLHLKREDLHRHGSHKGRSIPIMIKKYAGAGWNDFCVASSGNAAISAAITVNELNAKRKKSKLSLKIFVGKNINKQKLKTIKKLLNKFVSLQKTSNSKQSAFQMGRTGAVKNLRQSTDNLALIGYFGLAKELAKIKNLNAVFIPVSTGAAAQALYLEFEKLNISPQIHIVQTQACHPIADVFHLFSIKSSAAPSVAGAIVDKIAHRKKAVAEIVKKSKGNGWVCGNNEIKAAITALRKTEKITASPNSALSVAGLAQAVKKGWTFNGAVACVLTGK